MDEVNLPKGWLIREIDRTQAALAIVEGRRWEDVVFVQQERIEALEAENYALKYAAAGGEDAPGAANAVTVADVERWQQQRAAEARHYIDRVLQLEAELREAYRHIDECCPHRIPNDTRAALGEKHDE